MKTCLIYGHNGLDLDVTFNLVSFYKRLGFKTFFSEKLHDADLLVVVRAFNKEIDTLGYNFQAIHVYDYGGWGYDLFVNSVNSCITYIFCTSEDSRKHLIEDLKFPKDNVFVALPPVDVYLWQSKRKKTKYKFVHVGNFKPIDGKDALKEKFDNAIRYFRSHIWGLGWDIDESLYHDKAWLFQVSSIYAQSQFAFGLMYPFQRNVTFSGRFWHATLNGCYLFSEPGIFTSLVPGIIETDYTIEDIENKLKANYNSLDLKKEAEKFWLEQAEITRNYVNISVDKIKERKYSLPNQFTFIKFFCQNFLRKTYQKRFF